MRKAIAALAVLVSVTTATVDAKAAITDETLVEIFGDGKSSIPQAAQDCIRLLTGLDAAIYKDMPEDTVVVLKAQCRKDLRRRLDDPARNPTGLSWEDVEQEAVAHRVTEYRAQMKEAAAKAYGAKTAKAAAENKAAWLQKRAETLAHYSGLGASIDRLELLCGEWASHREALPPKKRKGIWTRLDVCAPDVQVDARKRAPVFVKKLKGLDEKAGEGAMNGYLLTPEFQLQRFAPNELQKAEERLKREIEEMKAAQAGAA